MHAIGPRSMLPIAAVLLFCAGVFAPAAAAAAAADERVRTYRVEGVRTAKDRAAVARTGVAIVGSDHGALVVSASRADARRLARLRFRVLRGSQPRLPGADAGPAGARRGVPLRRRRLPQLSGDGRRDGGDRRGQSRDREPHRAHRHDVPGPRDLRAEDLRQRRHRRGRARGALHRKPARPRAPHRRDGDVPAQRADEQVRHRHADHERWSTRARSGSCRASTPTARSSTSPPAPTRCGARTASPTRARRPSAPT